MANKIYVGNGVSKADQYGNESMLLKFEDKDVLALQQQLSVNKAKGVKGVSMYISKRKEVSKYGSTHYGVLNTEQKAYTKDGNGNGGGNGNGQVQSAPQPSNQPEHRYGDEDIPFN